MAAPGSGPNSGLWTRPRRWRRRDNPVKALFLACTGARMAAGDDSAAWFSQGNPTGVNGKLIGEGRGPIRECRAAVRPWAGGPARPLVPHRAPFLPVPHRSVRRRQELAAAPAVSLAQADARA